MTSAGETTREGCPGGPRKEGASKIRQRSRKWPMLVVEGENPDLLALASPEILGNLDKNKFSGTSRKEEWMRR